MNLIERNFSAKEFSNMTNVNKSTLNLLCNDGIIVPAIQHPGTGKERQYSIYNMCEYEISKHIKGYNLKKEVLAEFRRVCGNIKNLVSCHGYFVIKFSDGNHLILIAKGKDCFEKINLNMLKTEFIDYSIVKIKHKIEQLLNSIEHGN